MIGDLNAREQREAEEDEAMEPKEYGYRGRTFQIMIERDGYCFFANVIDTDDGIISDWESAPHTTAVAALMEATQAIRATVDDEDGMPF
jgi:hypothetical protein